MQVNNHDYLTYYDDKTLEIKGMRMQHDKKAKRDHESQILNMDEKPLYRFFETEEYADAFFNGSVRVSTLKKCREYDDPQQGDKDEGSSIYKHNPIIIKDRIITENEIQALLHAGIDLGLKAGDFCRGSYEVFGNTHTRYIPDGYILCTTDDKESIVRISPEWRYGIQINITPKQLFEVLSNSFLRHGIKLTQGRFGWARYDLDRIYNDFKYPPKDLAFIKPSFHKEQSEFRFFWLADTNHTYNPIFLDCPELKDYLTKLY